MKHAAFSMTDKCQKINTDRSRQRQAFAVAERNPWSAVQV